jgi:glycosyltransferase involved in cell wall biosynthesis
VLEDQAERLGLARKIRFLGYRSQAEVRDELRRADVFVLPSFAEGVPVVLMEALASGVPVVATRVAGVGELVEDGVSGYLVPPGDPTPLAEGIAKLIEDPVLRSRFGAAGRAKVEREFDVRREAARLRGILSAAL